MDGFSILHEPPAAYKEVKWMADTFVAGMGLGWIVNYALMIRFSWKGRPHCMALLPLCNNIAWELTYTIVYPSANRVELLVFAIGLTLNFFIMVGARRSARVEWRHSPLLSEHAGFILLVGTLLCFTGHVALAMEIGPGLAYSWGAVVCQLALSIGGLFQLLQRNSTAGTSWTLWSSRFLGSCCTVAFAGLRCKYWPEVFGWLASPLVLWSLVTFLLADSAYGFCLYRVSHAETKARKKH
uniref:Terpene cyclase idtB n=1 Tax=Claviceps paspali TaxID=40601 RepID=IDTB_CLAPA|nr:RecName: Full=Terpene cyclase idtB; AltName: Full=Indole-diterpene biosynthesis cluster protein B [Claviceps paspali]AFO85421.1 IdtB [Claviceps paspali]